MMFETLPFGPENLREEILNKQLEIPAGSDDLKDALTSLLQKDPTKRATITEVMALPWFII
jgi:serine/threonine protein kinase